MILQISLSHTFLGGQSKEVLYIGPGELEAGADIASHFREEECAMFSPFTAHYSDDETIEIIWRDKRCRYPIWKEDSFTTSWLTKYIKTVTIEDREYDNEHEVMATVRLLPHTLPVWDTLKLTCGEESVSVPRESLSAHDYLADKIDESPRYDWLKGIKVQSTDSSGLTLRLELSGDRDITLDCPEAPETEANGITFSLVSLSTVINEWDMMEEKPLHIRVPNRYLTEAETDCAAAFLLAELVQEQHPGSLEVIADYMRRAYELGSSDAEEWLKDYYSDDGRFDAYC